MTSIETLYAVCEDAIRSGQRPPWWLLGDAYEDEGGEHGEWMAGVCRWMWTSSRWPSNSHTDEWFWTRFNLSGEKNPHDYISDEMTGQMAYGFFVITDTLPAAIAWLAERLKPEVVGMG